MTRTRIHSRHRIRRVTRDHARCSSAFRAFTLIELVASISVGVVISGIAGALVWNASKIRTETAARSELVDTAAAAVEHVVRYLREIPQDECPGNPTPCLLGNAQIDTASAALLEFGQTGFRLSGGQLQLTTDGGANWHPLANDVSAFAFTYYDRSGAVLSSLPLSATDRHAVRRIHLTLDMSRGGETAKVRTGIYLRSFMNEVETAAP